MAFLTVRNRRAGSGMINASHLLPWKDRSHLNHIAPGLRCHRQPSQIQLRTLINLGENSRTEGAPRRPLELDSRFRYLIICGYVEGFARTVAVRHVATLGTDSVQW